MTHPLTISFNSQLLSPFALISILSRDLDHGVSGLGANPPKG